MSTHIESQPGPVAAVAGGTVIGTLGGLIGLVGFARYSRDRSFAVIARHKGFIALMALGSIVGTLIGALLLGFTSGAVLYPLLAIILMLSAIKVWRHAS